MSLWLLLIEFYVLAVSPGEIDVIAETGECPGCGCSIGSESRTARGKGARRSAPLARRPGDSPCAGRVPHPGRPRWGWPVLVPTHPRTRERLADPEAGAVHELIRLHEPFGFLDRNRLQHAAACVLYDSGRIAEESTILGFPAVTLRRSIERPEALETGAIALTDLEPDVVVSAVRLTMGRPGGGERPADYRVTNTSERVVNLMLSTAFQHRVWSGCGGGFGASAPLRRGQWPDGAQTTELATAHSSAAARHGALGSVPPRRRLVRPAHFGVGRHQDLPMPGLPAGDPPRHPARRGLARRLARRRRAAPALAHPLLERPRPEAAELRRGSRRARPARGGSRRTRLASGFPP